MHTLVEREASASATYFFFLTHILSTLNKYSNLLRRYDMAKPIPRIGSDMNGLIGLHKSACRIPKGVIQVLASFNNIIVNVTDVSGRVISWSSIGTCGGFKATKRTVVDQGMQQAAHDNVPRS